METMPVTLNGKYYTTAEAAKVLRCTDSWVRQMILSGEVDAIHVTDRFKLISASEVDRIKKIEHHVGRPRKYSQGQ